MSVGKLKKVALLLLFFLLISSIINIYQYSIVKNYRKINISENDRIIHSAKNAFKYFYKNTSNEIITDEQFNKFKINLINDNNSNSSIVEFNYTVFGSDATTKYIFKVDKFYNSKFKEIVQFGAL